MPRQECNSVESEGKRKQCWGRLFVDNYAGRYMPQGGCVLSPNSHATF